MSGRKHRIIEVEWREKAKEIEEISFEEAEHRRDHWLLVASDAASDKETADLALCAAEEMENKMQHVRRMHA